MLKYFLIFLLVLWLYFRYVRIIVTFQLLSPKAKKPTRAYHRAACYDFYSIEPVVIPAGQWREIRTGVAYAAWPHIHIFGLTFTPFGNVASEILTRSSFALKGLRAHLGEIDNDYRGEITVIMHNHRTDHAITIPAGKKVAQIKFYRVAPVSLFETKKLSRSQRGANGFGSSGE